MATSLTKARRWKSKRSRKSCSAISAFNSEVSSVWDTSFSRMTGAWVISQRGNHFCSVIFKNLCALLAGLCRQQIDARRHWHHVHVEMKHDLPAGGFAELLNDDPIRIKRPHCGDCDLLRGPRDLRKIIRRDVEDAACRCLWNHECMTR